MRFADRIFVVLISVTVVLFSVATVVMPKQSFSHEENRALATAPKISLASLLDGRLFEEISAFYSDHAPMRISLVRAKAAAEMMLGRRQNNRVIFCDNGRLIDRCETGTHLSANVRAVREFAERMGARCVFVPRSIDVCLKDAGMVGSEYAESVFLSVGDAELRDALRAVNSPYYKTDHHLGADGAYALYRVLSQRLDFVPYGKEDFRRQTVSEEFLGTVYSKSGLLRTSVDTVSLYRYDGDEDIDVRCEDAGCDVDGPYDFSALEKKDKYLVFFGGNHGVLRMTRSGEERETLLVVKDSFANAVLPLLARHFDIIAIDPRYVKQVDWSALRDECDVALVLCGVDTLDSDGTFCRVLYQ